MKKIQNKNIFSGLGIMAVLAFSLFMPLTTKAQTYTNYGGTNGYYDGYNYYNGESYGYNNYNVILNQTPVIFLINPNAINAGTSATTIAITGNYFAPGAVARINGLARTTTYMNSGYLQMQLNNSDTNNLGQFLITVVNPNGLVSNSAGFAINGMQTNYAPAPAPASAPVVSTPAPAAKTSSVAVAPKTTATNNNTSLSATALVGGASFLPSSLMQWLLFLILILLVVLLWRKIYLSEADKNKPLKHD